MAAPQSPAKKQQKAKKAAKPRPYPSCTEMVHRAIAALKERRGSSLAAIKKYISSNYKCDVDKLNTHIKNALKAGVVKGTLVQVKGKGASGSFKLGTKKADPEKAKAKDVARKKAIAEKNRAKREASKANKAAKLKTKKDASKAKKAAKKTTAKKTKTKKAPKKPATAAKKAAPKKSAKPKKKATPKKKPAAKKAAKKPAKKSK